MEFIIVGAQKCATSWLYYNLSEHPDVQLPSRKDERLYVGGDVYNARGDDWYNKYLDNKNSQKLVGDISVNYLVDPRAPKAVKRNHPGVKIIASLRNPVDRAISAYIWNIRKSNISEMDINRFFRKTLASVKRHKTGEGMYCPKEHKKNVILRGLYDIQIARYVETFGTENMFVLPVDKIACNKADIITDIQEYLGVDTTYRPSQLKQYGRPKQNSYSYPLLCIEKNLPNIAVFNRLTDIVNQALCRIGIGGGQPNLSGDIKKSLQSYYQGPVRRTFEIVDQISSSAHLWDGVTWMNESFSSAREGGYNSPSL